MMRASLRIRTQLTETPGCLRFANIVMSPREFWTVTVWRSRQEMLDFMRSGAHEEIMWRFSTWLDSFWLMRWRPSSEESGSWAGLTLAPPPADAVAPERSPEQRAALAAALESLPRLRAAAGADGAASLHDSPSQRKWRHMVSGAVGATIRVEVDHLRNGPAARRATARLRRDLLTSGEALRCAFGSSDLRTFYLLVLFRDARAWTDFADSAEIEGLRRRWPQGMWMMRWDADNEFGHWDGLRLRKVKFTTPVTVPEAARSAADSPGSP